MMFSWTLKGLGARAEGGWTLSGRKGKLPLGKACFSPARSPGGDTQS